MHAFCIIYYFHISNSKENIHLVWGISFSEFSRLHMPSFLSPCCYFQGPQQYYCGLLFLPCILHNLFSLNEAMRWPLLSPLQSHLSTSLPAYRETGSPPARPLGWVRELTNVSWTGTLQTPPKIWSGPITLRFSQFCLCHMHYQELRLLICTSASPRK